MSSCDYDNLIENLRVVQSCRPSDKPIGSREQFVRYDASTYEFVREVDARYCAMHEGNEVAHDLVGVGCEAAVEEAPCPEGISNMRDLLAEWCDTFIRDYVDESAPGTDLPSWDELREEWYEERLERET